MCETHRLSQKEFHFNPTSWEISTYFGFIHFRVGNNSKSGSSPKIRKFKFYPILTAVWALGCASIPLLIKSSDDSSLFFPREVSPLPAWVCQSHQRVLPSRTGTANLPHAKAEDSRRHSVSSQSTAGFRESEDKSTGATACHILSDFQNAFFAPLLS